MKNPFFRCASNFATELFRDLADPTETLVLERLLNQGINYSDIADQFLWDSVADL